MQAINEAFGKVLPKPRQSTKVKKAGPTSAAEHWPTPNDCVGCTVETVRKKAGKPIVLRGTRRHESFKNSSPNSALGEYHSSIKLARGSLEAD